MWLGISVEDGIGTEGCLEQENAEEDRRVLHGYHPSQHFYVSENTLSSNNTVMPGEEISLSVAPNDSGFMLSLKYPFRLAARRVVDKNR